MDWHRKVNPVILAHGADISLREKLYERTALDVATERGCADIVELLKTTVVTNVLATADIGSGNSLYVRGEGPGLNWDKGVAMRRIGANRWLWTTRAATKPFAYKTLVNDETWAVGDNCIAAIGLENICAPKFEVVEQSSQKAAEPPTRKTG